MFVFPAYDSNYTSRKRSLNSCSRCREKKIRCVIKASPGKTSQCTYCYTHNEICDIGHNFSLKSNKKKRQSVSDYTRNNGDISAGKSADSNDAAADHTTDANGNDVEIDSVEPITPEYLKRKFNFNLSCQRHTMTYQYVFHDHPKAVMGNKIGDENVWHESGVYLDTKIPSDNLQNFQVRKIYKKSSSNATYSLKNRKHYEFLLSINCFSLSDSDFQIEAEEIKELLQIYFFKINSIFPIVEETEFWMDYESGNACTVLIYALILAIARDSMAEDILKRCFQRSFKSKDRELSESDFKAHFRTFCENTYNKIYHLNAILSDLGDYNKLSKLIVSLVLTLHWNFDHQGNEQSSKSLTDAINYAVSLAIHMEKQDPSIEQKTKKYLQNLWWVCFVFDRFNSLINSRVSFIRTEDCNLNPPDNHLPLYKVVKLSHEIELMLGSVYLPYKSFELSDVVWLYKKKLFDANSYEKLEFEINDHDLEKGFHGSWVDSSKNDPSSYVDCFISFLTRVIRNVNIMAAQKLKYDDKKIPYEIPDRAALRASQNILFYYRGMDRRSIMNIPLIPWCVALAMAPSLKNRVRRTLQRDDAITLRFQWEQYMEVLKRQSTKWWIAEDICNSADDFFAGLERTINGRDGLTANHHSSKQAQHEHQTKSTVDNNAVSKIHQNGTVAKHGEAPTNLQMDDSLDFLDPNFFNSHFDQFDLLDLNSIQQLPDTFEIGHQQVPFRSSD